MTRWSAALLLLVLTIAVPAQAQNQRIAQVSTAAGTVTVTRAGQNVPLKIGDLIYQKDMVETGANSSVGITFVDNSVISTGADSRLVLEQFHFDSSNYRGDMLAKLQKGTLTAVSGDIAHSSPGAMKIQTPTAILGVRGTTFAVEAR
jgi:hypothetical protein